MSKTYEVQGPDGFTYEVTMPDNADEGAIVERVQAFAKAGVLMQAIVEAMFVS